MIDDGVILKVDRLVKHFRVDRRRYIGAINDVSFSLRAGQTLGLVGESGSGKSTIGRCIAGLEVPTHGAITFHGAGADGPATRAAGKSRRVQMVFQDPFASLNPRLTVRQTILEPLWIAGIRDRAQLLVRAREILAEVGLGDAVLDDYPSALTLSEQQRVGIARALISRPAIVVLDEPTSMLDPTARSGIIDVLKRFQERHRTAYLFISHDMQAVEQLSDRIAVLYLGRLVEEAPVEAMMAKQSHPYSFALLKSVLPPDPETPLPEAPIQGEIPSAINPRDECPFVSRCVRKIAECGEPFPSARQISIERTVACYNPMTASE